MQDYGYYYRLAMCLFAFCPDWLTDSSTHYFPTGISDPIPGEQLVQAEILSPQQNEWEEWKKVAFAQTMGSNPLTLTNPPKPLGHTTYLLSQLCEPGKFRSGLLCPPPFLFSFFLFFFFLLSFFLPSKTLIWLRVAKIQDRLLPPYRAPATGFWGLHWNWKLSDLPIDAFFYSSRPAPLEVHTLSGSRQLLPFGVRRRLVVSKRIVISFSRSVFSL